MLVGGGHLRPHEGWSETMSRFRATPFKSYLRPHEGWSETGEIRSSNKQDLASDPTRVGLKPCLKWRFQPLYQGVIG